MSRLIMFNLVTLDGFFEGTKPWELDWHQRILDEEFERFAIEQLRNADRLLFGRITFEGMAAHWPHAQGEIADLMNSLPKFVFSRTPGQPVPDWTGTRLASEDTAAEVRRLKQDGIKSSLVIGSGKLSRTLMAHDLFDEYRLLMVPIILGSGRSLFAQGLPRQKMKLLEARQLSSGGVILRYEPLRG